MTDRTSAGLLVVGSERQPNAPPPSGLTCGLLQGTLCIPIDARLWPDLAADEIRQLCGRQIVFIHPTLGAYAFEEREGLSVSDLLEPCRDIEGDWNHARPVLQSTHELKSIVLLNPPRIEDLFREEKQDIGSDPVADLPPAPDESSESPGSRFARILREMLNSGAKESSQNSAGNEGKPSDWKDQLRRWASEKPQQGQSELQRLRSQELTRLLHQLKHDPETGLKHAIPIGQAAHRGRAEPRSRLGERNINFDFGKIRSAGSSDLWDIPPSLHHELTRHYRILADRELKLGRYRRAAYIYAHLLGDLSSAAQTLKQGQHYREAALLYEEQLQNPHEAARCMVEGGLLREAIERFEKLEIWKEAAELYERLGEKERAAALWQILVDQCRSQRDHLGAARLLEERLNQPTEALAELSAAWPDSAQAITSLAARFELIRRLGQHEIATSLAQELRLFHGPAADQLGYLETISQQARRYPDPRVRSLCVDLSRVVASSQLQNPDTSVWTATRVVEHLIQLAPQDRLLLRDANRHLSQRRTRRSEAIKKKRAPDETPPRFEKSSLKLLRNFELPRQFQWIAACSEGRSFYALGKSRTGTLVARGVWCGDIQSAAYPIAIEGTREDILLEPAYDDGRRLILSLASGRSLPHRTFPSADLFFDRECLIQDPPWPTSSACPASFGPSGSWCLQKAGGRIILSNHDLSGRLIRTIDVTDEFPGLETSKNDHRVRMIALDQGVALACDDQLLIFQGAATSQRLQLPSAAVRLFRSPTHTRSAVGVTLEQGAVLHWVGSGKLLELDRDAQGSIGCSLPGGPIVLVSGKECQLFEVDSRSIHRVTRCTLPCDAPMTILPAEELGEFALFSSNGKVCVFSTKP